jgi:hypothetical protein
MIALISESMYDCHSPPNNNESSNTRAQYTLNKSRTQTQNCTMHGKKYAGEMAE